MTTTLDRTNIVKTCPKCPRHDAHPHLWNAKRGGYVCYYTDEVLSPDVLIQDPHDRRGVPQTAAQTSISVLKFPTNGLPLQATFIGPKQVEAMDGQLRDAMIVMYRDEIPSGRGMSIRKSYFALTPNGREWEYLGEAVMRRRTRKIRSGSVGLKMLSTTQMAGQSWNRSNDGRVAQPDHSDGQGRVEPGRQASGLH